MINQILQTSFGNSLFRLHFCCWRQFSFIAFKFKHRLRYGKSFSLSLSSYLSFFKASANTIITYLEIHRLWIDNEKRGTLKPQTRICYYKE